MGETKQNKRRRVVRPMTRPRAVFVSCCISILAFLQAPEGVSSQPIVSLAPDIPTAQCVLAVGASDINGNQEVDRFEFNQVILEVLSGCTLHDETISEWNTIFEELACLCQDYDDASCCTVGPTMMRPGKYPNEYTFRMCELLQDAVASQCLVFAPTSAPVLDIVGAPTRAPTDIRGDESDSSRSRLLIVMVVLLCFITVLILCLCCTVCYWRWLHLRRIDEQGPDEYEGQTFANTVAKGTLGAGGSDILLDMESQASSIEGPPSLEDEAPSDIPEEIVSTSEDTRGTEQTPGDMPPRHAVDSRKPPPNSPNHDVSLENDSGWEDYESSSSTDPQYIGEVDVSADEEGFDGGISGSSIEPNIYDSTSSDNDFATDDDNNADHSTTVDESPIEYDTLPVEEDPEDIVSNPEASKGREVEKK